MVGKFNPRDVYHIEKSALCPVDYRQFVTAASDVRLAPGCWPLVVAVGSDLYEFFQDDLYHGELLGKVYKTQDGKLLSIAND